MNTKSWRVSGAPATEPITIAELKLFARIDTTAEDTFLTGLIKACRETCELYLGRALITQSITFVMDMWEGNRMDLPSPPLLSVTGIYTTDEDGTDTTYSSDNYYVIPESIPGQIALKQGKIPPSNIDRDVAGYKIIYVAGYGAASAVPQALKEALKMWCTVSYEERAVTPEPPPEARMLLDLFRILPISNRI